MDEKEIQSFLIIFSIIAFSLALTVIILFAIFQRRKNRLLREQQEAESRFREEIIETQVEIREETLRNISWELHDNIGQLITLAKIQLQSSDDNSEKIDAASETISQGLSELRSLSKRINPKTYNNLSLVQTLEVEIARFNRLKFLEASFRATNGEFSLDPKVEIIIFRILQEFFTNTMKHSKASKLEVNLSYQDNELKINARDNGVGFDAKKDRPHAGIGLSNIISRAKLIGAQLEINSSKGKGTELSLQYKQT